MGLPPFDGAVQEIEADATPAVATTLVGAEGRVPGTITLESAEALLGPTALAATTEKAYDVPLASPVIVADGGGGDPVTVADTCWLPVSLWGKPVTV